MTTGHEAEFRALFAEEASGQLERIAGQALDLERAGRDPELVASLFRDAHTIKSSAALVGLPSIGRVAHGLEDVFEQLRSGGRTATPALVDAVLAAVDALRTVLGPMVAGEDREAELAAAEQALLAVTTPWKLNQGARPTDSPHRVEPNPSPEPTPEVNQWARPNDSVETMVVPVERLNSLVNLAGQAMTAQSAIEAAAVQRGTDPESVPEIQALAGVVSGLQRQVLKARTVAVGTVVAPLRRAVRDAARQTGKAVAWEVEGEGVELDRHVLERLRDPLLHLVRNAVDHGIETAADRAALGKPAEATVRLQAIPRGAEVELVVSDDGGGLSAGRDQIFEAGFSTKAQVTELSGRGVGLDVVRTTVEELRGRIEVESAPGAGTTFRIVVPLTLAVLPCLVAVVAGERYAIPFHAVEHVLEDGPETEHAVAGARELVVGDRTVPVTALAAVLELGGPVPTGPALLVRGAASRFALRVDALDGRRDVLGKELGGVLPHLPVLAGASVEADGSVMLVLDATALVERARRAPGHRPANSGAGLPASLTREQRRVLVVEDALTVRELQRSILERAGYAVETAVDGQAALGVLAEREFDLVVTDVEMPRMDGLRLTEQIRANPRLAALPVVIVTSLATDEHRRRGLDAGADAYLVKTEFDADALLSALARTLERAAPDGAARSPASPEPRDPREGAAFSQVTPEASPWPAGPREGEAFSQATPKALP